MKKDMVTLFKAGNTAFVYPIDESVVTPPAQKPINKLVEKCKVAAIKENKVFLEDGRVFVVRRFLDENNSNGPYMAIHYPENDQSKDSDYCLFPDMESLAETIKHEFLAFELEGINWFAIPSDVLETILQKANGPVQSS